MIRCPARLLLVILVSVPSMACISGCADDNRGNRMVEPYRERNAEWSRMAAQDMRSGPTDDRFRRARRWTPATKPIGPVNEGR
jgi:hypothetical protein